VRSPLPRGSVVQPCQSILFTAPPGDTDWVSLCSWFSSSSNAGEAHHSRSGWSPIPTGTVSNQPPSSRREHAVQPPPLTTALSGHQFQGLGVALGPGYASTPLSTTSLSSPFTQSQSPCVSSPSSAAVAPSPMASRHYNVPYNPRDWGPVNSSSSANSGQSAYPHSSSSNSLRRSVHRPPQNDPGLEYSLFFSCYFSRTPFSRILT